MDKALVKRLQDSLVNMRLKVVNEKGSSVEGLTPLKVKIKKISKSREGNI
ncbi:MAG: hypothetical protein MJ210_03340 [Alphaproteobacteria bacterium]|nr:hypothetical protein [Alphaproteobacteria bacterium]